MTKEKTSDPTVDAQAEADAILRFLERCAERLQKGGGYTKAPMTGRLLQQLVAAQRAHHAEHGPAHAYLLGRISIDLARGASDLLP